MEWARSAGRSVPVGELHPEVLRWIEREDRRERVWGVACSGGADSLLLLLLLVEHFSDRKDRMRVLHFDHRLRGEASAADARFVAEVAEGLGVPYRGGEWPDRPEGAIGEAVAREARLRFFGEALAGAPAPALFLGHQRSDVLETQLMRLCRGSGTAGLAAPRPVGRWESGRVHLRPLLGISGERIRAVLHEHGVPFREDASNAGESFFRNRLRLSVIPALRKAAPADAEEGAALSRQVLQEEDEALGCWLRELLPEPREGAALPGASLAGKPRALWRRALEEWLAVNGVRGHLARTAFEAVLDAWSQGRTGRFSAGEARWLVVSDAQVRVQTFPPDEALLAAPWPLPPGATIFFPGARQLSCRIVAVDPERLGRLERGEVETSREAFLAGGEGETLSVRHWEAGDRFRPLGAPGERKLQDAFIDRRVPREERLQLPVVFSKREGILWAPGLPPAESRRINPGTKLAVWLTYQSRKPA